MAMVQVCACAADARGYGGYDAPLRKGNAIESRHSMAVVLLTLIAVVSANAGPSARGRFVPNEIIVKFREQPADMNDMIVRSREVGP